MRILITGVTGFAGGHLVERLRAEGGHQLFGLSRRGAWPPDSAHLAGAVELIPADLTDAPAAEQAVRRARPDWVFHLAGYASPGKSFREPDRCWADNLLATRGLYDAVSRAGLAPRILFVSSGLVYGDPTGPDDAFDEAAPLRPASPYAASKAAADLASYQYTHNPGLEVVRVRPFNHIGPRQPADYAVANFARQVAAVKAGRQVPIIETGDLSARRDLSDVRDVVAAYRLLVEAGRTGEVYNVGRGAAYRMDEVLHWLVDHAGVAVEVRQAKQPGRKGDTAVSRADTRKIRGEFGWAPEYELARTLSDVLDYWQQLAAAS